DLPRVTSYCTAGSYRLTALFKWLQLKKEANGARPILLDECIYSVFNYSKPRTVAIDITSPSAGSPDRSKYATTDPMATISAANDTVANDGNDGNDGNDDNDEYRDQLQQKLDIGSTATIVPISTHSDDLTKEGNEPISICGEVFLFEYGVVVIWGMTEDEEKQFIDDIDEFAVERISDDDSISAGKHKIDGPSRIVDDNDEDNGIECEELHFWYSRDYRPRIYNDVIILSNPKNYMAKMAISHAIAQSTKLSLYESLIDDTIEATKHIPQRMAQSGVVEMSRKAITKKIGQLFITRVNVNLVSNILDTPEIFWSEPGLQPLYDAIRGKLLWV
ncbi:sporulation protein rmd1, partial [Spiromyces aspiralis]